MEVLFVTIAIISPRLPNKYREIVLKSRATNVNVCSEQNEQLQHRVCVSCLPSLSSLREFYSLVSVRQCAVCVIKTRTYYFSVASSCSALLRHPHLAALLSMTQDKGYYQGFLFCACQQQSTVSVNLPCNTQGISHDFCFYIYNYCFCLPHFSERVP